MNANRLRSVLSLGLSLLSLAGLLAEPVQRLISWKASLAEPYRNLLEIEAGNEVLVPIAMSTNETSLVFRAAPRTAYSFAAKSGSDLFLRVARIQSAAEGSGTFRLAEDDDSGGGHDPKIASVCFADGAAVLISLVRSGRGGTMSLSDAARSNAGATSGTVQVQAIAGDCVAAAAAAKAAEEKRLGEEQQRQAAEAASRLAAQMAVVATVPAGQDGLWVFEPDKITEITTTRNRRLGLALKIECASAQSFDVTIRSQDLDLAATLQDQQGQVVQSNDDGEGRNPRFPVLCTPGNSYRLAVFPCCNSIAPPGGFSLSFQQR